MGEKKRKVLLEASKILTPHKDGHKRYIVDLLRGLLAVAENKNTSWEFYVYLAVPGDSTVKHILDIREIVSENDPFNAVHEKIDAVFGPAYLPGRISPKIKQFARWMRNKDLDANERLFDIPDFDLIHVTIPQLYLPLFSESFADRTEQIITTVHDMTHVHYPQFHRKDNIKAVQNGLDTLVKRSSRFMTISESTARDLLAIYPSLSKKDARVVYPAFNASKFKKVEERESMREVMKKYHIPQGRFFLTLSTLEPRKNIVNTVKAFLMLKKEIPENDVRLVIAGEKGWKYRELFKDKSLRSPHIIFTGFIDEKDLAAVYSAATAFSYVSFYEGFGLPLLEAMSCGTPVIYGDNSSMPEVVGDGGLPADPFDVTDIKEKFKRILMNEDVRSDLSAKALANSKKFNMDVFINNMIGVYEKVLLND